MQGVIAFDFDDTLITNNPDEVYLKWLQSFTQAPKMPNLSDYRTDIVAYQNDIFRSAFEGGKSQADVLRQAEFKVMSPGMVEMLKTLRSQHGFKVIIVTDNNTAVVKHSIQHLGIEDLIDEVIANPAEFNVEGCLKISPWKMQDHCHLSFPNLCKGDALFEYVDKLEKSSGKPVDFVAYAGDNTNDICPSLRLRVGDIAFPRVGHPLLKLLESRRSEMRADIVSWTTGQDILSAIERKIEGGKK